MCDGCLPARERGPEAYLEYVRRTIENCYDDEKVRRAFEFAQHVIDDNYDDVHAQAFYTIFKSLALPSQPPKHWDMIDKRMREFLALDAGDQVSQEEHQRVIANYEQRIECMHREIKEEIGILSDSITSDFQIVHYNIGKVVNGVPRMNVFFKVSVPEDKITKTDHVEKWRWFTKDEFMELGMNPSYDAGELSKVIFT